MLTQLGRGTIYFEPQLSRAWILFFNLSFISFLTAIFISRSLTSLSCGTWSLLEIQYSSKSNLDSKSRYLTSLSCGTWSLLEIQYSESHLDSKSRYLFLRHFRIVKEYRVRVLRNSFSKEYRVRVLRNSFSKEYRVRVLRNSNTKEYWVRS